MILKISSIHHIFLQSSMLLIFNKHLFPKDIQQHHIYLQSSMLLTFNKHLVTKDIQPHIFLQSSI